MESETPTSEMTPSDLPHDPSADMRDFQGSKSAELCCTTIQEVSVADICTESILQVRVKTADMRVKSYAALMSNGTEFPPIVIFNDGQSLWLADGKHRIDAAKRNGYSTIRADVRHGTERDAFLYGLQVNAAHGLALTQAEKRAAVDLMLQDAEWGTWSDREIARQCGATHPSVSRRRQAATGKFYQLRKAPGQGRETAHGGRESRQEHRGVLPGSKHQGR